MIEYNQQNNLGILECSIEEIKSIVQDFVRGAVRLKTANIDEVELHGDHGCNFLVMIEKNLELNSVVNLSLIDYTCII